MDLFPETIETDRLRLEAADPETVDVLEFYEICSSDPGIDEVTEYVTWEPHSTPKETVDFLERVDEGREENERASYMVYPREGEEGAGEIAGMAGFGVDWDRRTMTLGTWLRKRFWGRGYSGERAAAFMAVAFDRLDLDCVAVTADADNDRSNRAIEKYVEAHGGRREGLVRNFVVIDGEPEDCHRYTVSREEWEASESEVAVRTEG
nr:GNAT family protein [Saliphagus sp. LR7]